jgi:hypothetical protein
MSAKRSGLLAPAFLHFMFSPFFGLFHQAEVCFLFSDDWVRGIPPIHDEAVDGWGTRRSMGKDYVKNI